MVQNLTERHGGNNIYLDFITSLHTLAHICTERFNLNQTLTPSTPSDLLPKPASMPHSAYHPIMSTTSSCQAVFKHKDRDSITAEWLWGVILCPLAPLLPPADTHLLHAVTVAGKWVRRSNQSVFCHQDGLPLACTGNNSQLLRSGHNTQSDTHTHTRRCWKKRAPLLPLKFDKEKWKHIPRKASFVAPWTGHKHCWL